MLRAALLGAAVGAAAAGICSPGARRTEGNKSANYVYSGGTETQRVGISAKEFMPSTGNIYYASVPGSESLHCYAGSPIGFLNADMCCNETADYTCPSDGFLTPRGGSILASNGIDNMKGDIVVPVRATKCYTPSMEKGTKSLHRTPEELLEENPPAIPYEYTGSGGSACDCRNEPLVLHVNKQPLTSPNSTRWQKNMGEKLKGQDRPNFGSADAGVCLFYEAGWGFGTTRETVPLIPTKRLNSGGKGRVRVSVEDAVLPFSNTSDPFTLPCGGHFAIDADLNYCFHSIGDDLTARYVNQKQVEDLSSFCYGQGGATESVGKAMRCCMKITVGNAEPLYTIKADIMAAAGCRNVNEAVNNGDGKYHTYMARNGPLAAPSLEEKQEEEYGPDVGFMYHDLKVKADQFRTTDAMNGFHEVCVFEDDLGAKCDAYTANPVVERPPSGTTLAEQVMVENTCRIPPTLITGQPNNGYLPEYAASLYNMHASEVDTGYQCKDEDAISTLIRIGYTGSPCDKLKSWSAMGPGVYHSVSGVPIPTAQLLGSGCDFTSAAKERLPIDPLEFGDTTMECTHSGVLTSTPYETVKARASSVNIEATWQTITDQCGKGDQACKFSPQYSYQAVTYTRKPNSDPFNVLTNTASCLHKAISNDGTVEIVDNDIIFKSASPRVVGILHPIYEGGGYIGGHYEQPGYRFTEDPPTSPTFEDQWMRNADNSGSEMISVYPPASGEITSLTGALVIDDACWLYNNREARTRPDSVQIAGQYPRFMDVGQSKSPTHYEKCYTPDRVGHHIQMTGEQAFFDIYGRGGGSYVQPGFPFPLSFDNSFIPWPTEAYYKTMFPTTSALAGSESVCGAFSADGCIGECDLKGDNAKKGAEIAGAIVGGLTTVVSAASGGLIGSAAGAAITGSSISGLIALGNVPEGSVTIAPLPSENSWHTFLRAVFEFPNPVYKSEAKFLRKAYEGYPSNIAATGGLVPITSNTKFHDEAKAFPAQILAAQLGCYSAENGGDFKAESMTNLQPLAHYEEFTSTIKHSKETLTFATVGKKDLPPQLQENHYYLHKDGLPYRPARDAKWRKCGLCGLYTTAPAVGEEGTGFFTPRIDDCTVPDTASGTAYTMRYSLNEGHNLLNTRLAAYFGGHYSGSENVEIQFGYLVPNGGKTMKYTTATATSDDSVLVQRLLGRNLSSPTEVLTDPMCTGDASAEIGVCTMNASLHLQWDHAIVCKDTTKSFSAACINPVWANDRLVTLPSAAGFVPAAERLSYCGAPDPSLMDPDYPQSPAVYSDYSSMYKTVNDGRDPTFIVCDNDRYNEEERRIFCAGSQTAVPGKYTIMGLRLRARTKVEDVCTIPDTAKDPNARGQCVLYPNDPEGWTLATLATALQSQPQATYVVNFVPVSFTFLERLTYWATAVETTWFNSGVPKTAPASLVHAYNDATETLDFMNQYNRVSWGDSAVLAPQMCQPGGPSPLQEADAFGRLWLLVESLRLSNNNFSIAALDGDLAKGETQTVTFTESEVYAGFPDVNARIGTQGLVLKSAFGEATRARASELAPEKLKPRFTELRRAKFDGIPAGSVATTCTRVYSEGEIQMYDLEFVQDVDGCRTLASVDRTPVVISGADARNSELDNVKVVGAPGALVVRGRDSSIYEDRVAANVDVDGLLLRGVQMDMRWRTGCVAGAVACANITTLPGISLALARADGNVVVDECPYGNANLWACTATLGREPPTVLMSTVAGKPMYDSAAALTPPSCSIACNATAPQCYQGDLYTCVQGAWTVQTALNPTSTTDSMGHPTDTKYVGTPQCFQAGRFANSPSFQVNMEASGPVPGDPRNHTDEPVEDELNLPPCAVYTQALMSTGALLRADNTEALAEQVLLYIAKLSSRQRCSTIGCPGANALVRDANQFWRCGTMKEGESYVEDTGFWEWHYHPRNPYGISAIQTGSGTHAQLPLKPMIADSTLTSPVVQQGQLMNVLTSECAQRNGTQLVYEECSAYSADQTWLFVRLGEHFRVEVPNNPYLCLYADASNLTTMMPCPPCLYGSASSDVTMNRYGRIPDLTGALPLSAQSPAEYAEIPLSTDPNGYALSVYKGTGMCLCRSLTTQPSHTCDCNLQGVRQQDVVEQLGPDACKTAAGSLLAACDRLGAGLAGVDGTQARMAAACRTLGSGIAELVGTGVGAGATATCSGNMIRIVTMGGNYVPNEPLSLKQGTTLIGSGFTAVTAKVVYQPHSGSMPTAITAPHRMVINATSFLAAFGADLYRITAEGFSPAGLVWSAVIVEFSICFVALICHIAFAATTPSRVAKVRERVSAQKKGD